MNLNDRQREAVQAEGPVLVVAGPGTGKTATLAARIEDLVSQKGVDPKAILAVTFTQRAAREMRERVTAGLGPRAEGVRIGTIHAACLAILRSLKPCRDVRVLDAAEQAGLLDSCSALEARKLLKRLSKAKGLLLTPEDCAQSDDPERLAVAEPYATYQKGLAAMGAFDFDDLIFECVRILSDDPVLLDSRRSQIQHLLVDEYQDVNHAQYRLIRLLAGDGRGLFAVGDPDQAIYAFRGADVQNFLDFQKDYPSANVIQLVESYRSISPILAGAQSVIQNNQRRLPGTVQALRRQGRKIRLVPCRDEGEQASLIVSEIRKLIGGFSFTEVDADRHDRDAEVVHGFGDFAVLYRHHARGRGVEKALRAAGLPFHRVGGPAPAEHKEIRDLLAYLRLAHDPSDDEAFRRIVNVPPRTVSEEALARLEEFAQTRRLSLLEAASGPGRCDEAPSSVAGGLQTLAEGIRAVRRLVHDTRPEGLLRNVISRFGLKPFYDDGSLDGAERYDRILGLVAAAGGYEHMEPGPALDAFLDEIVTGRPEDVHDPRADRVKLLTLHAAKGLEFPVVFLLDSGDAGKRLRSDMEEERRVFYVGMTRARDRLDILYTGGGSAFIGEIAAEHAEPVPPRRARPRRKKSGQKTLWRMR